MSFLGRYVISYAVVRVPNCSSEWALPDQLVFSTVSALLRICGAHPDYADRVVTSIIAFVTDVIANLKESTCQDFI